MIISTEAIYWFLTGKKVDDKTIFKLAKYQKVDVSDSLRKNVTNSFLKKHKQSVSTEKIIRIFFKNMTIGSKFNKEIDSLGFSSKLDLSTFDSNLKYIESGYSYFFEGSGLEDSFINYEIKKIFKVLSNIISLLENGTPEKEIEGILLNNELFSKLDLINGVWVDMNDKGIIHRKFSLNLLLYLCACIDVNNGRNEHSILKLIFYYLLSDINALSPEFKLAFRYYISIIQDLEKINGNDLSFSDIAKLLGIDDKRTFNYYKSGKRNVSVKHMNNVLYHGDVLYHLIYFWGNFLNQAPKNNDERSIIVNALTEYPQYYGLALSNFNHYTNKVKAN